jgi:hypothetical protein
MVVSDQGTCDLSPQRSEADGPLPSYLKKCGSRPAKPVYLSRGAWEKLLSRGIGGDQMRVNAREMAAILHAAERFEACQHRV